MPTTLSRIGVLVVMAAALLASTGVAAMAQPGFSQHPSDSTVFGPAVVPPTGLYQSAQFTVSLTGTPTPTCQWQSSVNLGATWSNLTNSPPYSGVTTSRLTVSPIILAMSATQFRCLASNAQGSLPSNAATLSVAIISPAALATGSWTGLTTQGRSFSFTVNSSTAPGVNGELANLSYGSADGCYDSTVTYPPARYITNNLFAHSSTGIGVCTTATRTITGTFGNPTTASGTITHDYPLVPPFGCNCSGTFQRTWSTSTGPALAPQVLVQPNNQNPAAGQNAQFTIAASGTPAPTFLWEMSSNGGGSWSNVPATSPYSGGTTPTLTILGTGLSGLNNTQFRARAANASGPAASNAATLTVLAGGSAPTTVGDTYATAFNTPLNVGAPGVLQNDSANGGGAMTAAMVADATHGSAILNAAGSFSYMPASGFSGADSFTYRASNGGGPGNVATVTITVAGPNGGPQPPTNLRVVSVAGNTVTFAWTPPTSGSTPTGFQIEGGQVPGQVLGALPLGAAPSVSIALPTGSFYLRVRTMGAGTTSGASNEVLTHVAVPVAPSPPANLLGLVVGNTLNLVWTNTFGGGAPTNVILDVTGAVTGSAPVGPVETFGVAGVPPGTYTITARATNAAGSSAASNPVTLTFPAACSGAPQTVANFVAYKSGVTLFLAWDTAASGPAPTGYVINVTGAFVGAVPTGLRAISAPVPAGTYNFSVVATNACGSSSPTSVQTVTIP